MDQKRSPPVSLLTADVRMVWAMLRGRSTLRLQDITIGVYGRLPEAEKRLYHRAHVLLAGLSPVYGLLDAEKEALRLNERFNSL